MQRIPRAAAIDSEGSVLDQERKQKPGSFKGSRILREERRGRNENRERERQSEEKEE